jgi:hypothetical protein
MREVLMQAIGEVIRGHLTDNMYTMISIGFNGFRIKGAINHITHRGGCSLYTKGGCSTYSVNHAFENVHDIDDVIATYISLFDNYEYGRDYGVEGQSTVLFVAPTDWDTKTILMFPEVGFLDTSMLPYNIRIMNETLLTS